MSHLTFAKFMLKRRLVLVDPEGKGVPCKDIKDLDEYLKRRKNIDLSDVHFSKDQKVVIKKRHLNFLIIVGATLEGGIEINDVIVERGIVITRQTQISGPIKINAECPSVFTELAFDEKRKVSISIE